MISSYLLRIACIGVHRLYPPPSSCLELDFAAGFTALTGETGAGKSILIDALSLALGERSESGMVRNGCERAEISAEFDISLEANLKNWLTEQALQGDPNVCLFRRVLDNTGRSRGFINGRSATLQQMREAGEFLLDVHGQHGHQSLLRPEAQRELLDGYAGLTQEANGLAVVFNEWQTLLRRRSQLEQNVAGRSAALPPRPRPWRRFRRRCRSVRRSRLTGQSGSGRRA